MLILLSLYVALVIFFSGNAANVIRHVRLPMPLRWDLYPIPKGPRERQAYGGGYFEDSEWWTRRPVSNPPAEFKFIAKEVLLLDTVRDGFPNLWVWSVLLHWGLYLCATALVIGAVSLFASSFKIVELVVVTHAVGCVLGLIGSVGLLLVRLTHPRLRTYTGRLAIFDLLLLGGIFATGLLSFERLAFGLYFLGMALRSFPARTLVLQFPLPIALHLGLVAFFMAYFPFTHMTHAYMKFFSWHGVRWDDRPALHDPRLSESLSASMQRHVTWAAPHIAAEEPTSWADAVVDAGGKVSTKGA